MGQPRTILLAATAAVLFGWIAGAGVASWTHNSIGGSGMADWAVGLGVAAVTFIVGALGIGRVSRRGLLGQPERLAGGVGEESATSNSDVETGDG